MRLDIFSSKKLAGELPLINRVDKKKQVLEGRTLKNKLQDPNYMGINCSKHFSPARIQTLPSSLILKTSSIDEENRQK